MRHDPRCAAILGLVLVLGLAPASPGQRFSPPGRPAATGAAELDDLARELADEVRSLSRDIETDLGRSGAGRHLVQDAQELARAIDEFQDHLEEQAGRGQLRRAFAGIDSTWGHLQEGIDRADPSPRVSRSARRVDQLTAEFRQALGLVVPDELGDLAREMAEQVVHLAEEIEQDLGGTRRAIYLLQDTRELGQSVSEFRETLRGGPDLFEARRAFADIDQTWDQVKAILAERGSTPSIDRSVRRIDTLDGQIREALGLVAYPRVFDAGRPADRDRDRDYAEVRRTVRALHRQAEALVAAMQAQLVTYPNRDHVLSDATRLVQRSESFEAFLAQGPSPEQVRTAYAPINDVAACLHNDLSQQPPPAAVVQAWQSFSQTQHSVHQVLEGLPAPPPVALAPLPPPPPLPPPQPQPPPSPEAINARRISVALHQRAEVLVATMRNDLHGYPNQAHVFQDATQIVSRTGAFYEFLAQNPSPEQIRAAYAPINEVATCLQGDLTRQPPPPSVLNAWQSFTQAQYLIHDTLQLPPPPPTVRVVLRPPSGPSPIVALTDQLVAETEAFLRVFGPTVRVVPEGEEFFADGQRLREEALQFRQAVTQEIDPNRLAGEFGDIDAIWRRLVRRTNRIAKGRTGPNIQQIHKLGAIVRDIHQVLGLPGYEPLFGQQ